MNHLQVKKLTRNEAKITLWLERWFLSSNAKDIGTLYLIFALFSGLIGTAFSVLIRLELSGPGVQYISDNQLYNSIITAHAIVMIFFMVKKFNIFNIFFIPQLKFFIHPQLILYTNNISDDNTFNNIFNNNKPYVNLENSCEGGSDNNNKGKKDNSKHKYAEVKIDDPFNKRDIILKISKKQKSLTSLSLLLFPIVITLYLTDNTLLLIKSFDDILGSYSDIIFHYAAAPLLVYDNAENKRKQIIEDNTNKAGVYRWVYKPNGKCYVGSSANLGYRLKQYYSDKYLTRKKSVSSISSALVKYGHSSFKLEILVYCEPEKSIILEKEQFYIDEFKPEYNILPVAGSPLGYKHTEESLAKMRGRKLSQEHKEQVLTRLLS